MAYLEQTYKIFDPGNSTEYHFLDQNFANQYESEKKQGNLSLLFTLLAMTLSLVGLFGLVSFTVQQLTKEIGIRKVLGASLFNIVQLLSKLLKLSLSQLCCPACFLNEPLVMSSHIQVPLRSVFLSLLAAAILAMLTLEFGVRKLAWSIP